MSERRVLVAYATRAGSTRSVAERLATRLREGGSSVDVREASAAGDAGAYDAVVLGSAVYGQAWLPEARALARRDEAALAARPLWLFSVGSFGDGRRLLGALVRQEPRGIGELRGRLGARGYRVFAGVIERHQWPLASRLLFRALGGRFGDRRDWAAIDAWGQEIAAGLRDGAGR
ncbi:MAG: flavodoxin domain-containing protein [Solirubrobacteraceae bacterium]